MPIRLWKLRAPANPQAAFARALKAADAANAARNWRAAEAGYAAALSVDRLRADLWVQHGHVLKEQGRLDEAVVSYEKALRVEPLWADAHLHLGHLHKRCGRPAEALAAFSAALATDPDLVALRPEIVDLGGVPPAPKPPPAFRELDDLPVRSAEGIAPPAAARRPPSAALPRVPSWPAGGRRQNPIVFLHLHKTGGLTLEEMIARHVPARRICPIRDDHLHLYTQAERDAFDLFSGHFDYGVLRLLERPIRTVSIFREPRARLISFYRFHAGHDLSGRHGVNTFARLANHMSAEAFFEDPRIRQAPEVFNHYLTVFGLSYRQVRADKPVTVGRVTEPLVERTLARVRGLDGIGLLERFDESAALVFANLGLPRPPRIRPINRTDKLATRMKGKPQPPVAMTPRLAEALADLTRFDDVIYRAAQEEFERRYQAFEAAGPG